MRDLFFSSALVGLLALASPAMADENDWAGLYKGLDALDGSIDYLSIAPSGPGEFELRTVPSIMSLCKNGRGWIVAEGRLADDNRLHRFNARAFCEDKEPFDIEDRFFVRDAQTGIIRFDASDDRRPLIYHRISTK